MEEKLKKMTVEELEQQLKQWDEYSQFNGWDSDSGEACYLIAQELLTRLQAK